MHNKDSRASSPAPSVSSQAEPARPSSRTATVERRESVDTLGTVGGKNVSTAATGASISEGAGGAGLDQPQGACVPVLYALAPFVLIGADYFGIYRCNAG